MKRGVHTPYATRTILFTSAALPQIQCVIRYTLLHYAINE